MASTNTPQLVALPQTLNKDTPEMLLAAGETPQIRNMVPHANALSRRGSYTRINGLDSEIDGPAITAVGNLGSLSLISTHTASNNQYYVWPYDSLVYAYETSAPTVSGDLIVADTTSNTNYTLGSNTTQAMWGYTFNYEGCVLGVTQSYTSRGYKGVSNESEKIYGTAMVAWAGATGDYGSSYNFECNFSNGGTTVSLSTSEPQANEVGHFIQFRNITPNGCYEGDYANNYWYRIIDYDDTGTTDTYTVARPLGLDLTTTDFPDGSGENAITEPIAVAHGSPPGLACINVFQDRVFAGRGSLTNQVGPYKGYYSTLLSWTTPGNPWQWPDENFIIVDQDYDDPIMALVNAGEYLLILKRFKTYVLSGYDESTFTLDLLSDRVGCISSGSAIEYEQNAVWRAEDGGLYIWDGSGPMRDLYQPAEYRGIKRWVKEEQSGNGVFARDKWCPMLGRNDDNIIYSMRYTSANNQGQLYSLVTNMVSGNTWEFRPNLHWVSYNNTENLTYGFVDPDANTMTMVNLDKAFDPLVYGDTTVDGYYITDVNASNADVVTSVYMPFLPSGNNFFGDTYKINGVQVFHDTKTTDSDGLMGILTLKSDQATAATTVGEIRGTSGSFSLDERTFESYTKFQQRGRYFRFELASDYSGSNDGILSGGLHAIRVQLESTARTGRVGQNTA